jgi:hypothetical protein
MINTFAKNLSRFSRLCSKIPQSGSRLLVISSRKFTESKQQPFAAQEIKPDQLNPESPPTSKPDESLKVLSEYQEALQYFQKGKYRISDEYFKRTLNILEKGNQKDTENYIHVLKK